MPCLILTGHPCCGKSTVAQLIRERCRSGAFLLKKEKNGDDDNDGDQHNDNVVVIDERLACPSATPWAAQAYADSLTEKATRGSLKAAFDRAVFGGGSSSGGDEDDDLCRPKNKRQQSQSKLVVLDSLNYIKGFRYELYCICKSAQERHAVIWIVNDLETVRMWNDERRRREGGENSGEDGEGAYSDELLNELVQRYEPPDERNRWDRPLYVIDLSKYPATTGETSTATTAQSTAVNAIVDTATTTNKDNTSLSANAWSQTLYNMHQTTSKPAAAAGATPSESVSLAPGGDGTDAVGDGAATGKQKKRGTTTTKSGFKKRGKGKSSGVVSATFRRAAADTDACASSPQDASAPDVPPSIDQQSDEKQVVLDLTSMALGGDENEGRTGTSSAGSSDDGDDAMSSQQRRHGGRGTLQDATSPTASTATTLEERVDEILKSFLLEGRNTKVTKSTSTARHEPGEANLLHKLDTVTMQVCNAIHQFQQQQQMNNSGDIGEQLSSQLSITVSSGRGGGQETKVCIVPYGRERQQRRWSSAQLRQLRQQYLQWVSNFPPDDTSATGIATSFAAYLDTNR